MPVSTPSIWRVALGAGLELASGKNSAGFVSDTQLRRWRRRAGPCRELLIQVASPTSLTFAESSAAPSE